eukprot:TRINITY_DN2715_c0_g1_i2.p2 TRINITY_DN2715_c0_g1~~TRINITY_DN2715_c0_g1_i2.p2  ORF type:complete len:106 (-),score=8.11 TRINITY_DN2715_c0_g1_i2:440-757(-)
MRRCLATTYKALNKEKRSAQAAARATSDLRHVPVQGNTAVTKATCLQQWQGVLFRATFIGGPATPASTGRSATRQGNGRGNGGHTGPNQVKWRLVCAAHIVKGAF